MLDLRYTFRQLVRSPGFSAVALLTLTLGMGANTAFFSVLYGVVLRQPPYPDAGRLVSVRNLLGNDVVNGGVLSRGEVRDYQERQRAFEGIAASSLGRMTLTSAGGSEALAERVKYAQVTPNLFSILGVTPERGRGMRAGDERAGTLAVVSHELWQSRFGGTEDILNRTVRLNGVEHVIVGVMPAGFAYPEGEMAAWTPLDRSPSDPSDRTDHYLFAIGRRAEGVSAAAARLDLQRVARDLQQTGAGVYPSDERWSIGFTSLRDNQFGRMLLPLGLLMTAAASVLLIACVNVAIMSLLRALARRREMSIRIAIGATRRDVVRQLVTEASLLCVLGAAGGWLLAQAALEFVKAFAPADIPRLHEVALNVPTALFTSAVLILVTRWIPRSPWYFAQTTDARYSRALALPRFTAGLVGTFSTLALLLAGVGIFGVTGYAVAQRTREFGIRLALGALLGVEVGSLMSGVLFGVEASDRPTLIAVIAAIGLTAMLASLAPLRHAVSVNPAGTLRAE